MITNPSFRPIRSNIFNSSDVVFLPLPKLIPHEGILDSNFMLGWLWSQIFGLCWGFFCCSSSADEPETFHNHVVKEPLVGVRLVSHGGCHQAAWVRICLLPSQPGGAQLSETSGISPNNSSDLIWKKRKKLSSFFVADNTRRSTTVGAKGGW